MFINHKYNIDEQYWEFEFHLSDGRVCGAYMIPSLTETDKLNYLVNWLNKCIQENEKETSF